MIEKKGGGNPQMFTLPPEGGKVALPSSAKGEQEIFRDDKGCNWIQNEIIITNYELNLS